MKLKNENLIGHVKKITEQSGNHIFKTVFGFDINGNLESEVLLKNEIPIKTHLYYYNKANILLKYLNFEFIEKTNHNYLKEVKLFTFDKNGSISKIINQGVLGTKISVFTHKYNENGSKSETNEFELIETEIIFKRKIKYKYNHKSLLIFRTYFNEKGQEYYKIKCSYDNLGNISLNEAFNIRQKLVNGKPQSVKFRDLESNFKNGLLIREDFFNDNGIPIYYTQYQYNSNGILLTLSSISDNSNDGYIINNKYEFDTLGNWVFKDEVNTSYENGDSCDQTITKSKRIIEYYS